MDDKLELQIRSDGDPTTTRAAMVRITPDQFIPPYAAFRPGLDVGGPLLNSFEFAVAPFFGERAIEATVTVGVLGMGTSVEVIAVLAEPIPLRNTRRVYVLSGGTLAATVVCDADTGERIPFNAVRVVIVPDALARAWVS